MEKNELSRKYELMIILDANLSQGDKDAICKSVADIIQKAGGKVINSQVWQEKHKLTFPIKKCNEGTYYLINFEAESSAVDQMRSNLRLNEKVLRFTIISNEAATPAETARA